MFRHALRFSGSLACASVVVMMSAILTDILLPIPLAGLSGLIVSLVVTSASILAAHSGPIAVARRLGFELQDQHSDEETADELNRRVPGDKSMSLGHHQSQAIEYDGPPSISVAELAWIRALGKANT